MDFSVLRTNLGYAEGLARQLAGFALLDHPTPLVPSPPAAVNLPPSQSSLFLQESKSFRQVLRLGPAEGIDVGSVYEGFMPPQAAARTAVPGGGGEVLMPGMAPFHLKVEFFGQKSGGGRGFQRPAELPVQRRFVPVQPVRTMAGTGVFLPRTIHKTTSKPRERKDEQEQKQEKQLKQKSPNDNGVTWKKTLPSQPSLSPTAAAAAATAAEIGLPQDWTY